MSAKYTDKDPGVKVDLLEGVEAGSTDDARRTIDLIDCATIRLLRSKGRTFGDIAMQMEKGEMEVIRHSKGECKHGKKISLRIESLDDEQKTHPSVNSRNVVDVNGAD